MPVINKRPKFDFTSSEDDDASSESAMLEAGIDALAPPRFSTLTGAFRPTLYTPAYCHVVYKLRLLGHNSVTIARIFGVKVKTLRLWTQQYPDFAAAWANGGDLADAEVAIGLFQRATGYSHPDVKIFLDSDTKQPIYAEYVKHYPPDTQAAIFWLSNRNRWRWKNISVQENTGPDGAALVPPQLQINFVTTPKTDKSDALTIEGEVQEAG